MPENDLDFVYLPSVDSREEWFIVPDGLDSSGTVTLNCESGGIGKWQFTRSVGAFASNNTTFSSLLSYPDIIVAEEHDLLTL